MIIITLNSKSVSKPFQPKKNTPGRPWGGDAHAQVQVPPAASAAGGRGEGSGGEGGGGGGGERVGGGGEVSPAHRDEAEQPHGRLHLHGQQPGGVERQTVGGGEKEHQGQGERVGRQEAVRAEKEAPRLAVDAKLARARARTVRRITCCCS